MLKVLNTKENASSRIDNMAIDEEKGQRSCEISDKEKLDTHWLRAYSKGENLHIYVLCFTIALIFNMSLQHVILLHVYNNY